MRAVQLLIRDSLRAVHEKARLQQRQAFRELEEEGRGVRAERDRLQDCFVEEWKHFGGRAEENVSMLGVVMARHNRRFAASCQADTRTTLKRHRVKTPIGRVLTYQERAMACKRRVVSDPYMSDTCATLGRIHLPCVPRPLADDPQAQARYDAQALLASMNSTRKAAILWGVNDRISRAVQEGVRQDHPRDPGAQAAAAQIDHRKAESGCPAERDHGQRQSPNWVQENGETKQR